MLLCLCARAGAQEPPPGPEGPRLTAPEPAPPPPQAPVAAVPEASFKAVLDQTVAVTLTDGRVARGKLIAVDAGSFTLVTSAGRVASYPIAQAADLRLVAPSPAEAAQPAAAPAPVEDGRTRVGLFTGFPLLTSGVDVESGGFYGFASTSILLPVFASNDPLLFGFAVGAGGSWRVASDSRWHFDFFGVGAPLFVRTKGDSCDFNGNCTATTNTEWALAVGVGAGVHATFDSGLTLAIKIPVLGFAFGSNGFDNGGAVVILGGYYLLTAASQPLFSFGYRW